MRRLISFKSQGIFTLALALSAGMSCDKIALYESAINKSDSVITVTVDDCLIGQSKFLTGLSHVDYTLRGGGNNPTAQANAKALLADAIAINASHVHGFGVAAIWPQPTDPAPWNWGTLDAQMGVFSEMGGEKAIILYGFPWWMRGILNSDGTTTLLTSADQFSDEGRVLTSQMDAFDDYVDAIARRYLVAPHHVRTWVFGNESKGYYNRRDGQPHLWDSGTYPGTPGNHADHGYMYLYNRWVSVMEAAAIAVGVDPSILKLGGPYTAVRTQKNADASTVPSGHPLYGKPYGAYRKAALNMLDSFVNQATRADFIAFDAGSRNASGGENVDIYERQKKWGDMMAFIQNDAGGTGSALPVYVTETYLRIAEGESATEEAQAAFKTVGTFELVRSGYTSAWLWSPLGKGEPNVPEGGLMTGTETVGGAVPKAWYTSWKTIHEEFPAGAGLYKATVSNSGVVEALANASSVFLVNKTAESQDVEVNGVPYILGAYECKLVEWD